jgi:hypothetical protein
MRFLVVLFVGLALYNCSPKKNTITFINESKFEIDSLFISVSSSESYISKHFNIKKSDSVITSIPDYVPKSNKHDITVRALVYIKQHDVIDSYQYNDLSGTLLGGYTITFKDENDIRLKVDYVNN